MKYTIESFEEEFGIIPTEVTGLLENMKIGEREECWGICYNLSDLIEDATGDLRKMGYDIVGEFSIGWKHHTGDKEYPIPTFNKDYNGLWKGKQLEYRLDLIDYIIKQLKEIK